MTYRSSLSFLLLFSIVASVRAENWPRLRGADGSAVSLEKSIPVAWSQSDYEWVTDLPGEGHSSPVIWDQDLFVTTAMDKGRLRDLLCLDAFTGKIKWSRASGFNLSPKHSKNSFASSTPATDGERVYVAIADEERFGLAAYDHDGNLAWRNWLGPFLSRQGQATSPIVFEDLVIIPNDQDGPSSIVACDRRDGRVVWNSLQATRDASYATPWILETARRKPQLICLSGATGISSLDPWSGEINWSTAELLARLVGSPTRVFGSPFPVVGSPKLAPGYFHAIFSLGGEDIRVIGVDPTGVIDLGTTDLNIPMDKDRVSVPSAVAWKDSVFIWTDNGFVICLDPKIRKTRWKVHVGGNFCNSAVCIDGRLYCIEESGKVIVVSAGTEFRLLGENPIGDPSYSSPAVANGRLYLRSTHRISSLRAKSADQ